MSREKAGKPGTPAGTATGPRSKINRIAAAMTHAVFVLAIALAFMRGGEPQATVKEAGLRTDAPAEKAETARLQQVPEPEKPTSGLPDGLREEEDDGDAAAGEMDEQPSGEEFELAQNSRRSRRERRRERERQGKKPPRPSWRSPCPHRSAPPATRRAPTG